MTAPCAGVPRPVGRPAPSGGMLTSHAATSAAVASRPSPGPGVSLIMAAGLAHPASATTQMATPMRLRVDILHLAALRHAPGLDGVVVEDGVVAMLGHQLFPRGLYLTGAVRRTALQDGRRALPLPGDAEAGQRARQDRRREHRLGPRLPAVRRHLDLDDGAVARPGDAGYLVEARAVHGEPRRRTRDDRLHVHRIREHERL